MEAVDGTANPAAIALGALFFVMIQHLSGGAWGIFRRVFEASSRTLPLLARIPEGDGPFPVVVFSHGGGYLPFYSSRADHTWEVRPETRVKIPDRPPSDYMKMLYYDTMVFQPLYLRHLIEIVGAERVMLGTDFPFDMGETDPVGLIDATDGLSDTEREGIKGGNAARLFSV